MELWNEMRVKRGGEEREGVKKSHGRVKKRKESHEGLEKSIERDVFFFVVFLGCMRGSREE